MDQLEDAQAFVDQEERLTVKSRLWLHGHLLF